MKTAMILCGLLLLAAPLPAEEIICKGSITSVQGEGLVARPHRFEVGEVRGNDLQAILEQCKKITREKQERAARRNPGGNFRPFSDVQLDCSEGAKKFQLRRSLRTTD